MLIYYSWKHSGVKSGQLGMSRHPKGFIFPACLATGKSAL